MIKIIEKETWNLNDIQYIYRDKFVEWCNIENKINYITECPFCKSNDFKVLSNVDRFGLSFNAIQCNKCDLVMTNPQIKEKYLSEYYNNFYHPLIFGTETVKDFLFDSYQGQKIFKKTVRFLNKDNKRIKVFEIGAGNGSNLKGFNNLAKQYGLSCELMGLEYNEKYVEKGKRENIILYSEDLNSFVKKNNITFDVIILSHVFEHVINFKVFLQNIKKLMHKNSILYIEVPGILKLHENLAYKATFKRYLVHAHIYHFTAKTLANILIGNNLKIYYINEKIETICSLNGNNMNIPNSNVDKYLKSLILLKPIFIGNYYIYKIKHLIDKVVK